MCLVRVIYLFNSLSNDKRCGNTLAHCFFKLANEIYGGTPTSLDNIKIEPEFAILFVDLLFVQRTHITHKTKFKLLLADTILIFHGSFLEIIGNEPSGRYEYATHHYFHHRIISVLSETKISIDTFH